MVCAFANGSEHAAFLNIPKLTVVDVQVSGLKYTSPILGTWEHSFAHVFIGTTRGFAVPHCGNVLPSSLVAQLEDTGPE